MELIDKTAGMVKELGVRLAILRFSLIQALFEI
jgi:hypothetical protein